MPKNRRSLAACFGAVTILSASALGPVAMAATADPAAETIIVTGSRIARSNVESPSPIVTINSAEISAVGANNLGEFLQRMPQTIGFENNSTDVFSSTSSGLQLTALRNLGSERTLVLVNGQRFVSGLSPGVGYGVDLNAIPVGIIDRIEIITGGYSAVYGSDAVAGVINVITKTDFEGFGIDAQAGIPEDGDRNRQDVSVTIGSNFERGNAWASWGWSKDEGMKAADRDFAKEDIIYYPAGFLDDKGGWDYLGSGFPPQGHFGPYNGDGTTFVSGLGDIANSDRFNRASARDLASPVDRRLGAAGVTFDINDQVSSSILLNYSQVEINSEFEPFPLDLNDNVWDIDRGGTGGMDVATGPMIPTLLRDNLLADGVTNLNDLGLNGTARRLTEFGNRGSAIDRTTLRVAGDIDYQLNDSTTLSVFATWGQTDAQQQDNVGINRERAAFALDVEPDPNLPGALRCVDETARLNGCAPFNVFGAGTISPAAVDYLRLPQNLDSEIEQTVVGTSLTGPIPFELPGGAISYAVGLEYRDEKGSETPDSAAQAGVSTSNRILATSGSFDVTEGYAEVSFPVIDKLIIDASYRIGDYSTVGNIDTWGFRADSPLTDEIRLRGTYSSSVRAPNVADLYAGAGETFETLTDACNGITATDTGNIADNCRSIPAIANRIAAFGSFALSQVESQSTGGFNTGNPNVDEETADSWTFGVVLTPAFAEGLSVTIDYYNIEVTDAITTVSRTDTVTRCYEQSPTAFALDPTCSGAAIRDPAPNAGALTQVNARVSNEEDYYVSGVDVQVVYSMDLERAWDRLAGTMSINFNYSYLDEWDIKPVAGGQTNQEKGEIQYPENRWILGLAYTMDRWTADWTVNYIGQVVDGNVPGQDNADIFGDPLPDNANTCAARFYNNAQVGYDFTESIQAFGGIANLLDQEPCILGQNTQYGNVGINTDAALYDVTGREFYFGVRARL